MSTMPRMAWEWWGCLGGCAQTIFLKLFELSECPNSRSSSPGKPQHWRFLPSLNLNFHLPDVPGQNGGGPWGPCLSPLSHGLGRSCSIVALKCMLTCEKVHARCTTLSA